MVQFTDRELDVMTVLWERGPSTVAEVQAALADRLAYTTVLTILRLLEEKGHVGHAEEGRAHRFHPLVERDARLVAEVEADGDVEKQRKTREHQSPRENEGCPREVGQ